MCKYCEQKEDLIKGIELGERFLDLGDLGKVRVHATMRCLEYQKPDIECLFTVKPNQELQSEIPKPDWIFNFFELGIKYCPYCGRKL